MLEKNISSQYQTSETLMFLIQKLRPVTPQGCVQHSDPESQHLCHANLFAVFPVSFFHQHSMFSSAFPAHLLLYLQYNSHTSKLYNFVETKISIKILSEFAKFMALDICTTPS